MRKGAWWTSSAEIICACTWYRRHPAAAGPLVRERERGFHRWLDSNPPRRAVSLINLSSAMRLRSHRCVSSFIRREQPEKDHGSYAFPGCQRLGWRGGREHQWGGGVLCLLYAAHASPPAAADTCTQHAKLWKQEAALFACVKKNCQ